MTMLLSVGLSAVGTAASPASAAAHPAPSVVASAPTSAPRPSGGSNNSSVTQTTGTFFSVNSTFALPDTAHEPCEGYNYSYNFSFEILIENYNDCFAGPQNPSIVNFGGSDVGVGYSSLTNLTPTSTCAGLANTTGVTSAVAFQRSNNSGENWGSPVWINTTCAYYDAFEPSFGISDGTVYGTFVESNVTNTTLLVFPQTYTNRTQAALGFTESTNGGASFSTPVTLPVGTTQIAYPQLAAFGDTIYIAYVNIQNLTNVTVTNSVYGSAPYYPESVDLIYSSDGGSTWNGPFTLPGLNASDFYTANSPSIAVNVNGEVAVSYATNDTCIYYYLYCYDHAESIVVSTSTTNGTSWSGPSVVAAQAGYDTCSYETYNYYCNPAPYQWGPSSSIDFDPIAPSTVYVAWVGSYYTWNTSTHKVGEGGTSSGTPNIGYGSALFDAVSTNDGANWTDSSIEVPETAYTYDFDHILNPDLTVSSTGKVYVSYTWENETCNGICAPPFQEEISYWVASSTNGISWVNYIAAAPGIYYYETYQDWTGLTSAITVDSTGPVSIYSQALGEVEISFGDHFNLTNVPPIYEYWWNYSYSTQLLAAYVSTSGATHVNFTESGLAAGLTWGFTLSGGVFTANTSTIEITNVPIGSTLYYETLPVNAPTQGWSELIGVASIGDEVVFSGPSLVTINFTNYWGVAFILPQLQTGTVASGVDAYLYEEVDMDIAGTYYYSEWYYEDFGGAIYYGAYYNFAFPWYLPQGTNTTLSTIIYSTLPATYVFGSGNGSATGAPATAVMQSDGPINETYFFGALGVYSIAFTPVGLPSGTPYSFDFAGTAYNSTAPDAVTVSDVFTGEYPLTDVTASSLSSPGWVYFAPGVGSEVDVPLQVNIALNFTTEVDASGTPGTAHFHAVGLATGDNWQLDFNGTSYQSSTPWINLTVRQGTYGISAPPIVASANESVAYTAQGVGPTLSVTPGSSYTVSFTLSYRVLVSASSGGTATGLGTHWFTPGSTASYEATTSTGYTYLGWDGSGTGAYSGPSSYANITVNSAITETAQFQPLPADRFALTVAESGLPSGTWWTVDLNGTGYSSDQSTLVIPDLYSCSSGAEGQYAVAIPYVYLNGTSGERYVASGFPSSTCTTGSGSAAFTLTFHAQYLVTPTTNGNGTATLTVNGLALTSPEWVPAGSSISISESAGTGYSFAGWIGSGPGSYTGSLTATTVIPTGPVTELATFAPTYVPPATLYTVSFELVSTLAPGTLWTVTFNGSTYSSTGAWINVSGLVPNTYTVHAGTTYSPDRTVQYTPKAIPSSEDVTSDKVVQVGYSTSYWVAIQSSAGGSVSPSSSSYYAVGTPLTLTATPAAGYVFLGWVGTGAGAYTGSDPNGTATVSASLSEVASFGPAPPSSTSTSSSSFWTSTSGIAVLAVVGLAVGLLVGLAVFRTRKPKGGAPEAWDSGGGQ
jgi:Divergent InlB B-repeat domain